ncbi:PREDICTED: basic leucine zipper 19-like [Tarenaya hassleriana]|uniref:basic leucine zipper 19-like n=1 Tax=Tarenaya hassleriana TaxID=28532 RepID=UPI00053C2E09|nr:PREDICTED: basic leucine zipper 19-like [Tarenaya hassleriana]
MDEGELDFSNQELFSSPNMEGIRIPLSSCSMDSFFDELLKDPQTCTHTHTCNPPGPENTHSHTCFHVHTKFLPLQSGEKVSTDDTAESSEKRNRNRPSGNREAVRKYREKKRARAASLEDEVIKLRAINQQLLKRLQSQAGLEAEVARLKCLLVDIRGRIEGEIGTFPYQKPMNTNFPSTHIPISYIVSPCDLQSDDQAYCPRSRVGDGASMNGQGLSDCYFDQLQRSANQNSGTKEHPACVNTSDPDNRKGGPCAAKAG